MEKTRRRGSPPHRRHDGSVEDSGTLAYLQDTASQAGLETTLIDIEEIGLRDDGQFVDLGDRPIELAFKLYPWEWMFHDAFGARLATAPTRWVEPPWKAILSNKGILPLLWEMFPNHPEFAAGLFRGRSECGETRHILCQKAALFARRRECCAGQRRHDAGWSSRAPTVRKASSGRRWRRCRISPISMPCSEAGWSITRRADYRSARTKIRSPAIRRNSCRTQSLADATAQRAEATALSVCGIEAPGRAAGATLGR